MLKIRFVLVLLLVVALNVSGQPFKTAAGLRFGFPYGISVKHFLDRDDAIEFVAAANLRGFIISALFENEHETGLEPRLYWYWGLGVHAGVIDASRTPYLYSREEYAGPVIGVDALIGLEYVFRNIPLNLSFDILPSINLGGYTGWNGLNTAISVRYVF
ncbi:MAG TPA: hypothetical protein PK766_10220 [Bacteroidales bacterium]|nr:hypothetical protein [Bacteroidales bacterium]